MVIYTVKKGDSVYKIAHEYSVSPSDIISLNCLRNPSRLSVGQALLIPTETETHVAESGESITGIAEAYGISPYALWRANPIIGGRQTVLPSQRLMIPKKNGSKPRVRTNAFAYPHSDDGAIRSVLPYLTYITVLMYGMMPDGSMIAPPSDDRRIVRYANEYDAVPLMFVASSGADGMYSSELANSILSDSRSRENAARNIADTVNSHDYGGAVIDFEYFSTENSEWYSRLISDIKALLAPLGKKCFVAVPPDVPEIREGGFFSNHDCKALGEASDGLILMNNELVSRYDRPQAIIDIRGAKRALDNILSDVASDKVDASFRNFGFDWALPFEAGKSTATSVPDNEAASIAFDKKAEILYDSEAEAPYFRYFDVYGHNSTEHIVYFDDARSTASFARMIKESGINSLSLWTASRFFPEFWGIVNSEFEIMKMK